LLTPRGNHNRPGKKKRDLLRGKARPGKPMSGILLPFQEKKANSRHVRPGAKGKKGRDIWGAGGSKTWGGWGGGCGGDEFRNGRKSQKKRLSVSGIWRKGPPSLVDHPKGKGVKQNGKNRTRENRAN